MAWVLNVPNRAPRPSLTLDGLCGHAQRGCDVLLRVGLTHTNL